MFNINECVRAANSTLEGRKMLVKGGVVVGWVVQQY